MEEKTEEDIKRELRKRHDLGQPNGSDRLYLDALELIEKLERKYEDICKNWHW